MFYSYLDQSFPLEYVANLILDNVAIYVTKPSSEEDKQLYLYFGKLLAFYGLTKKLASSVKTDEGMSLLTLIENEISYYTEDIEADEIFKKYPKLKESLLKGLKDCIERLASIIHLPPMPKNTQLPHFLSLAINETSLVEIFNVIGTLLNYASDEQIQQAGFQDVEEWLAFVNEIYDECILVFYTIKPTFI